MSYLPSDDEILNAISQGRLPHANACVAYRQMKALESIAECVPKLASPPMLARPLPEDFDPTSLRKQVGIMTLEPSQAMDPEAAKKLSADILAAVDERLEAFAAGQAVAKGAAEGLAPTVPGKFRKRPADVTSGDGE